MSELTMQIAVRVTADEYDQMRFIAAADRRKLSDWVRLVLADAVTAAGVALPSAPKAAPKSKAAPKAAPKGKAAPKTPRKPRKQLTIDGGEEAVE